MIWHCDIHGQFDTDEHPDGCPRCQAAWDESVEADRQLDEEKLNAHDTAHRDGGI